MYNRLKIMALGLMTLSVSTTFAQETAKLSNKKDGGYQFTVVRDIEATEVQNQA